jgi:hypothetical protein
VRNLIHEGAGPQGFYKLHNISGRAASLAVFAVFQQFISDRLLILRGIPRLWPFPNLKNSEIMAVSPLFFAVFWLFAVFVATIATFASGHCAESVPLGDRRSLQDTRTGNVCQLIIAFIARSRRCFAAVALSCIIVPLH